MLWGRFADETVPYAVSVDMINDQVSPENVVIEANMELRHIAGWLMMKQSQRDGLSGCNCTHSHVRNEWYRSLVFQCFCSTVKTPSTLLLKE
jgi:hypothetical protein